MTKNNEAEESAFNYYTQNGMIVFGPIILYIILGASIYQWLEKFSVVDSYYFVVITLSTIGYGDISPHTNAGKIFTIFFVIIGLAMFSTLISTIVTRAGKRKEKRAHRRTLGS
jgi:Na+/melibiose symporter-like transporter